MTVLTDVIDSAKTLTWLEALCSEAHKEAQAGDTMLANRLGTNQALSHYFNNVHMLKTETPSGWTQHYPSYLKEADRLRQEAEFTEAQDSRLTKVEEGLGKILKWVDGQIALQEAADKDKAKDKPKDKAKPKPEDSEET